MKMNPEEWQEMLGTVNRNKPRLEDNPALRKTAEKLIEQVRTKKKKLELDALLLWGMVNLIEIHGMSKRQAFKWMDEIPGSSEARAKNLWNVTQKNDPGRIEDIRQAHAYSYVNNLIQWVDGDQTTEAPSLDVVQRLRDEEPVLYGWAFRKAYMDSRGEEYEDFKPNYEKITKDELSKANMAFIGYLPTD